MTWRRHLAKALELEPAGMPVPVSVEPDGSVLLHLGSKPIDLGCLPEGVVDQDPDDLIDGDILAARHRLPGEVHQIPSKRVLGGAGLALLLAAFFLCHARQPIRRETTTEAAA